MANSYGGVNLGQLWLQANQAGVTDGLRLNQEERTAQDWYTKMQNDSKNAASLADAKNKLGLGNEADQAAGVSKVSGSQQEKASYVMNYMMTNYGYSKDAAGAIAGNLMAESAFNTNIEGDKDLGKGRTAFGLAQWREGRFTGLQNFAKAKGKSWNDFDTQLDYVAFELKQPAYSRAENALRRDDTSLADKASAVDAFYEISAGHHRPARIAHANNFVRNFNPEIRSLGLVDGGRYGDIKPQLGVSDGAKAPSYAAEPKKVKTTPVAPSTNMPAQKFGSLESDPLSQYTNADIASVDPALATPKQADTSQPSADDIFLQGYKAAFDNYATRDPLRYTPDGETP